LVSFTKERRFLDVVYEVKGVLGIVYEGKEVLVVVYEVN